MKKLIRRNCGTCGKETTFAFAYGDKWNNTYKCINCWQVRCLKP